MPAGELGQTIVQNAAGRIDKAVGFDGAGNLTLHPSASVNAINAAASEAQSASSATQAATSATLAVATELQIANSYSSMLNHIITLGNPHQTTAAAIGAVDSAEKSKPNGVASLSANIEMVNPLEGAAVEVAAGRPTAVKQADGAWSVSGGAALDANGELVQAQSGAAAQAALGRTSSRKRADGSWDGVAIRLPIGYDVNAWTDDLVSGQLYQVLNPLNAPALGEWFVEVLRTDADAVNNQVRIVRLTSITTSYPRGTEFTASVNGGFWTAWERVNMGGGSGWLPVTLINGNLQLTSEHLGIRKTPDGTVTVSGSIYNPTASVAFIIPAGYRSNSMTGTSSVHYSPAQDDTGGLSYCYVSINGANFILNPGVGATFMLVNHSWQVI